MVKLKLSDEEAAEVYEELCSRWNGNAVNRLVRSLRVQLEKRTRTSSAPSVKSP